MKSIILVTFALVAVAIAVPVDEVKILESKNEQTPEGSYSFSFKSEDGTAREETAKVKEVLNEENKPVNVLEVRGFYSYSGGDGKPVVVTYEADEYGFRAEGESIPKAPAARR